MHNTKPRMLVFSHLCSPDYVTGAEKLLLFMIRELLSSYDCTLVVPGEGMIAGAAREMGVKVSVVPVPLVVSLYLGQPDFEAEIQKAMEGNEWKMLTELLMRSQPDAVLVSTAVHPLPAVAAKSLGIPTVWAIMETMRETEYTTAAAAWMGRHADRIIGISASTLRPFLNAGLADQCTALPPSWQTADLAPESWTVNRASVRRQLGLDHHHVLIGYIASAIYESKGLHHFMEAAIQIARQHQHAQFLIVGNPVDEGYFGSCLDAAKNNGIMDQIRLIRFEERIERIYPAMDIVVIPSLTAEGFGMTALEGMVFGKPVVSYASGGLEEIHRATGNEALAVPTGDAAALAERINQLTANAGLRSSIGERSSGAAASAFGIEGYRERLHQFLAALQAVNPAQHIPMKGSGPAIYIREGTVLRPFASEEAFRQEGYSFEQVRQVPDALVRALPHGEPIGAVPAGRKRRRKVRRLRKLRKNRAASGRSHTRNALRAKRGKPKKTAGRRVRRTSSRQRSRAKGKARAGR
ncbi:glycosyltransferase [Paenibacillus sambharensis]|uniref:Glycosyltransferase n=1 Tax=Paenibacillus sambharensis TaxID=1803190 RepID=A0A2W1LTM7_9BACL|nr:glycosyltransferase family 4 protein [Paenibacillus sambharensis]PZD95141.1 glycosyltransferase [Paenibacillus sambharensis]